VVTTGVRLQYPYSWSPDGRFLAYDEQDTTRGGNSWILPLDGDRKPWLWDAEGKNITLPAFSPDGRWLAYQSTETGRFEVYVRPFPGPGEKQRVSGRDGGLAPVWRRDGREILYLASGADDHRILAADVVPGPTLRFANPHVALAPDGRRLFMVRPDPQEEPEIRSLTLIRNWAEEVKAKLAGK
jgi:eukaryotic-like serine/threonine-protein kinase